MEVNKCKMQAHALTCKAHTVLMLNVVSFGPTDLISYQEAEEAAQGIT